MPRAKKPVRTPNPDPVAEKVLELRDRVEAHAKDDVIATRARHDVLFEYAFRVLAKRRRRLGLAAIQELAPWLAKFVRRQAIQRGRAMLLADCLWDFTSDDERAWIVTQPALAHLVPPPIAQVLVEATWNVKQRVFLRLRERDPSAARALLESPPDGLTPSEHRQLINLLRSGLSEGDRPLLEREQSPLLAFLPGSSLWQELGRLADRLTSVADRKLRLTPPDRFEDAFQRLGLDEKKGADASFAIFTTQQYWLYQFLRVLPLAHLAERWQLDPGSVIDLFLNDAEHGRYRWAIYGNIFRLGDPVWSRALLDRRARFDRDGLAPAQCCSLARHLPPHEREAALAPFFDDRASAPSDEFADAFDHVWSASFTRRMLARVAGGPWRDPTGPDLDDNHAFKMLVHHGNASVIDELAVLVPDDLPDARGFRDDLAAAWRERDEILSRF